VSLDESAGNRQPEPGPAAVDPGAAGVGATELVEGLVGERRGEAVSLVDDPDRGDIAPVHRHRNDGALGGVTDCVVEQVANHAADRRGVAVDGYRAGRVQADLERAGGRRRLERLDRLLDELGQIDVIGRQLHLAGLETREQEQIVDQRRQRSDVVLHRSQIARRIGGDTIDQRFDRRLQRGERRAQVMADAGEHGPPLRLHLGALALEPVELLGQRVEGAGDAAQFVGTPHAGARRAVAILETADRCRQTSCVVAERSGGDDRQD
jgi:hypothetical protein